MTDKSCLEVGGSNPGRLPTDPNSLCEERGKSLRSLEGWKRRMGRSLEFLRQRVLRRVISPYCGVSLLLKYPACNFAQPLIISLWLRVRGQFDAVGLQIIQSRPADRPAGTFLFVCGAVSKLATTADGLDLPNPSKKAEKFPQLLRNVPCPAIQPRHRPKAACLTSVSGTQTIESKLYPRSSPERQRRVGISGKILQAM
jgi:hypothetical protein